MKFLLTISFILVTIFVEQMKIVRKKVTGRGADEDEGVGMSQFFKASSLVMRRLSAFYVQKKSQ